MSAIFILVSASLIVAGGFLIAFIWSVKSGQYDDDYTPSVRILFDDGPGTSAAESSAPEEKKTTTPDNITSNPTSTNT